MASRWGLERITVIGWSISETRDERLSRCDSRQRGGKRGAEKRPEGHALDGSIEPRIDRPTSPSTERQTGPSRLERAASARGAAIRQRAWTTRRLSRSKPVGTCIPFSPCGGVNDETSDCPTAEEFVQANPAHSDRTQNSGATSARLAHRAAHPWLGFFLIATVFSFYTISYEEC